MTDIPLPRVVVARPFGAPPEPNHEPEDYHSPPLLTPADLADKLAQIARLLRALTVEEMWTMCSGMNRPEMDKVLIAWAKHYMDPEANPQPPAPERRA